MLIYKTKCDFYANRIGTYESNKNKYIQGDAYFQKVLRVENIFKVCKNLSETPRKINENVWSHKNSAPILAFVEEPKGYKV